MSLATKNVATVLVGSVLVLALSFAVATPAKADMLSDLQAQVQALLAQIASLSGGSTSASGCFAFTMTHQMGSTGGEVMQIQKFLNSHGAQVAASGAGSPGNESSYYGALTRAAVAKWQAANGVSPAAGFWGPITRAKVASVCATATTPTTPTTPTPTLNGTAGTASFDATSEDVEDTIYTGQTEKVLGLKIEAQGSDLRVTNVRVKFTAEAAASASDLLANYFNEISIWANGTKIGSMSASSFTRDSAGIYSASIPVDQIIRMGSGNKVTFHVGASAVTNLDTDDDAREWTAEITQVRYTDATAAVLFEDPAGNNTDIDVDRVSSASDVKLRMGEGSGNPKAGNVKVSESNTTEATLVEFTLKAEGADMYFDALTASTTAVGVAETDNMVQVFYLMRGSTRIAEETATTATGQVLTFSLDDVENLAAGSTQTYRVVAKLNAIGTSDFSNGDYITASTSPSTGDINARAKTDGKIIAGTSRAGSVTAYRQTFYSEGIQVSKVGESFVHTPNDTTANSSGEFKVNLRVANIGNNDVYIPLSALASTTATVDGGTTIANTKGVNFYVTDGTTATSTTQGTAMAATLVKVSGGTEGTNSVRIGGGQSADFQLTVSFNPDLVYTGTRQFRVQVLSVGHATTDTATPASLVPTTPLEDFRTAYYTIWN